MTNIKKIKKIIFYLFILKMEKQEDIKEYLIKRYDFNLYIVNIDSYPTIQILESFKNELKGIKFDMILAIGGGSVIDTGKVLSVFLDNQSNYDLKTIVNNPKKLDKSNKIELNVFPTTAGTGAEVTQFATIWDFENNKKYSLDHKSLLPDYYFLDSKFLDTLKNQKIKSIRCYFTCF